MGKFGSIIVNNPVPGVLAVGGISGLIAVIIAGSICIRYIINGPEEVPQILAYALSTIIGFYFGTGVSQAISAQGPEKPH